MRHFLASVRSGVVKTFRCTALAWTTRHTLAKRLNRLASRNQLAAFSAPSVKHTFQNSPIFRQRTLPDSNGCTRAAQCRSFGKSQVAHCFGRKLGELIAMARIVNLVTGTPPIALTVANNCEPHSQNSVFPVARIGIDAALPIHRAVQHGFYAKPWLRRWSIVWFATYAHSVVACWFATPWTPPLWQRGFFLVNFLMLRRFLPS